MREERESREPKENVTHDLRPNFFSRRGQLSKVYREKESPDPRSALASRAANEDVGARRGIAHRVHRGRAHRFLIPARSIAAS